MKEFNIEEFKEEFEQGDLNGLEYIGSTIIKDYKERIEEFNKTNIEYCREEYIVQLYYATLKLNYCNDMYESCEVETNFNFDYYANIRDLLFKELGILEELKNEI